MKVFLIGYMGSGKSTIGRRLARTTGFAFADMDAEIEREQGCTVAEIFEREGEAFFRTCERRTLERLASEPGDMIISTGGGVACSGDNMELMNRAGMTVYLKMSPEKLVARLGQRDKRPIIRGMDDAKLLTFITENLGKREPYYSQAAVVVDADGASDDYVCRYIARCIACVPRGE